MKDYVNQPMITYIGNKRKLVDKIESVIKKLNPKICVDAFSGSGVVARMLLTHAEQLYVNDLEIYCEVLSTCYLNTPSPSDQGEVRKHIEQMNKCSDKIGMITELYSPNDDCDRCFYTPENAMRIDGMMDYIKHNVPEHLKPYC